MNLKQSRIGLLTTPTAPLLTMTVVSYDNATFQLTVNGKVGVDATLIGMAIEADGNLLRIKAVDITGANAIFTLAANAVPDGVGDPLAAGATVYIYNVRRPFPKIQRLAPFITENGDGANQLSGWVINGVTDAYSDGGTLYWDLEAVGANTRISIYSDAALTALVARGTIIGVNGTITITDRNGSGIYGSVVVAYTGNDDGDIEVGGIEQYMDYDVSYDSLGANDNDRSKACQGPVAIVEPAAYWCDVGDTVAFTGAGSFATYNGYNGGARDPATLSSYAWWKNRSGYLGAADSAVAAPNLTFNVAGFDYLKLTVTDSNSVTQDRLVPIWCGSDYLNITRCSASWKKGNGYSIDIEIAHTDTTPDFHVINCQCAIADIETKEILFTGYIWPESVRYNFEKSTVTMTILSELEWLRNIHQYPFRIQGQKGDPIQFFLDATVAGNFDMLTMYRALYFLLRFHSNVLELANVSAGDVTLQQLTDDRKCYIMDYTAGTLLQQIASWAEYMCHALYPHRVGGFSAILDPLYSESITDVADDAVTYDLTDALLCEIISYDKAVITMAENRLGFFWHTPYPALDFYPGIARCPQEPEQFGAPGNSPTRMATDNGTYTGTDEALIWCGRIMSVANRSDRYTLKHRMIDVAVPDYLMVDIPLTPGSGTQRRLVIDEQRIEYSGPQTAWDITTLARSYGKIYDASMEPEPDPPDEPPTPPVIPDPDPPEIMADGNIVAFLCREEYDDGGTTKYRIRVAVTDDFLSAPPTWTLVTNTGLPADSTDGTELEVISIEWANGGATPFGLYVTVERYDSLEVPPDGDYSKIYYNPDPFGVGIWSEVAIPANYHGGYDDGVFTEYAIVQADPFFSGKVLINIVPDTADPRNYMGFFVVSEGIAVTTGSMWGFPKGKGGHLNWNGGLQDYILSDHLYQDGGDSYMHVLSMETSADYQYGAATQDQLSVNKIQAGTNLSNRPDWINQEYARQMADPGALAFWDTDEKVRFSGIFFLYYGYDTQVAVEAVASFTDQSLFEGFGQRNGTSPNMQQNIFVMIAPNIKRFYVSGAAIANSNIALWVGTNIIEQVSLFSANDGTLDFVTALAIDAPGTSASIESLQMWDLSGAAWTDKQGNLAILIPGNAFPASVRHTAIFWGDMTNA